MYSSSAMVAPTALVLGASYGGLRAAQVLTQSLPKSWRVVVIERNTHMNHLYVLPRYAVVHGHEHKAFIPYRDTCRFPDLKDPTSESRQCEFIHGHVTSLSRSSVQYIPLSSSEENTPPSSTSRSLAFDYLVYALGSQLPVPIDMWTPEVVPLQTESPSPLLPKTSLAHRGTKTEGILWLESKQSRIQDAGSILIIGGGALGVQFASDIAAVYPTKTVTLVHSGPRLLPRFNQWLHEEAQKDLEALGVNLLLSSRIDLSSSRGNTVRTYDGRLIEADLILLCTGQKPNTSLLSSFAPHSINTRTGLASVSRTLQLSQQSPDGTIRLLHPHIFVVGDVADAFGALNAGHTAAGQGALAAKNIVRLVKSMEIGNQNRRTSDDVSPSSNNESELERLEEYSPPPFAVKVTMGLNRAIWQNGESVGAHGPDECAIDLNAAAMWKIYRASTDDMTL